jgi:hypothetical protein
MYFVHLELEEGHQLCHCSSVPHAIEQHLACILSLDFGYLLGVQAMGIAVAIGECCSPGSAA